MVTPAVNTPAVNPAMDVFFTKVLDEKKFKLVTVGHGSQKRQELQSTGLPLYDKWSIHILTTLMKEVDNKKVRKAIRDHKLQQINLSEAEAGEGTWPAQNSKHIEISESASSKTFLVKEALSSEKVQKIEPVAKKISLIFYPSNPLENFKEKFDASVGVIAQQKENVDLAKTRKKAHKFGFCWALATLCTGLIVGIIIWGISEINLANNITREEKKLSKLNSDFKNTYTNTFLEMKQFIDENKHILLANLDQIINHHGIAPEDEKKRENAIEAKKHLKNYIELFNDLPQQKPLPPTLVVEEDFTPEAQPHLTDKHLLTTPRRELSSDGHRERDKAYRDSFWHTT